LSLHWNLWYIKYNLIDICLLQKMLRFFKVEDRTLKRHISIGVFVVYIDTGSPVFYMPSKSRDLADENNKILTEWKWFETTVFSGNVNTMPIGMDLWYPLILESTDLQQAAELNSTRNVKSSDVNFHRGTFSSWFRYMWQSANLHLILIDGEHWRSKHPWIQSTL
jgi:hypothetical protein